MIVGKLKGNSVLLYCCRLSFWAANLPRRLEWCYQQWRADPWGMTAVFPLHTFQPSSSSPSGPDWLGRSLIRKDCFQQRILRLCLSIFWGFWLCHSEIFVSDFKYTRTCADPIRYLCSGEMPNQSKMVSWMDSLSNKLAGPWSCESCSGKNKKGPADCRFLCMRERSEGRRRNRHFDAQSYVASGSIQNCLEGKFRSSSIQRSRSCSRLRVQCYPAASPCCNWISNCRETLWIQNGKKNLPFSRMEQTRLW